MLWLFMVYDSPFQLARYMLLVKRPPATAYLLRTGFWARRAVYDALMVYVLPAQLSLQPMYREMREHMHTCGGQPFTFLPLRQYDTIPGERGWRHQETAVQLGLRPQAVLHAEGLQAGQGTHRVLQSCHILVSHSSNAHPPPSSWLTAPMSLATHTVTHACGLMLSIHPTGGTLLRQAGVQQDQAAPGWQRQAHCVGWRSSCTSCGGVPQAGDVCASRSGVQQGAAGRSSTSSMASLITSPI
jgi:hypothetical protein